MKALLPLLFLLPFLPLPLQAQQTDSLRSVEKTWLWGVGCASVLDTYLSPQTYKGLNLTVDHRTSRAARWGHDRWLIGGHFTGHLALVSSPTDDARECDAQLSAAVSTQRRFQPHPRWTLAIGPQLEFTTGGTYNTRNGNNPAQARIGLQLQAHATAAYRFPLFRRTATATLHLEAPVVGTQFAPEYGQSYYEIFSLGHTSGIVHLTHPFNAPTAHLQALLTLPIRSTLLTLGYQANVRQSHLSGLKRHAWRNTFVVGFTRHLHLIR